MSNAPQVGVWRRVALGHLRQLLKSYYVGAFQVPGLPERLMSADGFAVAKGMLTLTSREGTFSDADLARYVEAWSKPRAFTAMIDYYRALKLQTLHDSRVRPPTLILWGAKDAFLEREVAEANLALCDDGRLMMVEEATHWVLIEEPERTSAEIVRFFSDDGRA